MVTRRYCQYVKMKTVIGTVLLLALATCAVRSDPSAEGKVDFNSAEVKFFFYSRKNIDTPIQMWIGDLNGALFGYAKNTKFVIHGYEQSGDLAWVIDMKTKLVTAEDCNVVVVDWKNPAAGDYSNVRLRSKLTGEVVSTFINYLVEQGTEYRLMHMIGYSIGAHVAGYAGKMVPGTLGRISGLDPNSAEFNFNDPSERLSVTDASFVDVMHTCGGDLSFFEPLGHVDFFPNNGRPSQPGCAFEIDESCSHLRAIDLYIESIWSTGFKSRQCGSWKDYQDGKCNDRPEALMGFKTPAGTVYNYYLETFGMSPFAKY